MTCEDVERHELAERYVLGRLEKDQQKAFENHYFRCSACLERLRIVEEACHALAVDAPRPRAGRWRYIAAGLAAAAALVLALRVTEDQWRDFLFLSPGPGSANGPAPPPSRGSASPSRPLPPSAGAVKLPRYTAPQLRSTPPEAQRVFREAMDPYSSGNCDDAVSGLRRAVQMDESLIQARFYLAACELILGRPESAEDQLHRVVAGGESPHLEDAHFFLAKARIQQGDVAGARQELARVIAMKGQRRTEAQRLLAQLR